MMVKLSAVLARSVSTTAPHLEVFNRTSNLFASFGIGVASNLQSGSCPVNHHKRV